MYFRFKKCLYIINELIKKYFFFFSFLISYFLYFLSLEKCYEGPDECCIKINWIKKK